LGLRARLHGGRLADAPGGRAGRLRARDRRDALGSRVPRGGVRLRRPRLARLRRLRRALPAPGRGRPADRRLYEGAREARLGADRALPRACPDHGRRRPRAGAARRALPLMGWPRDDAKLERVRALMAEQGLDALVVRAPDNVLYLTNFWGMKGYDACVFPREGEPVLITIEASAEDAARTAWTEDVRLIRS